MAPNRQDSRIARLDTPLGGDELALSRFEGSESLSGLFEFQVEAVSKKNNIPFDEIIGHHCTITFNTIDDKKRYFDGIATEGEWAGVRNDNFVYRFVLRPWFYLLSHTTNCFIFHNKSVVDIIQEVLSRHSGLKDFTVEDLTRKDYPKLEYVVQYRESDMDFIRRLAEQHGIGFYFRHRLRGHKLVFSDGLSSYDTIPGGSRPFIGVSKQHRRATEHFQTWTPERRFTSGKVMLKDYDFKKPTHKMDATQEAAVAFGNGSLEVYDYPGLYMNPTPEGEDYARVILHRMRAADGHFRAAGDCVSVSPGSLMTLTGHDDAHNREYLALRCHHSYTSEDYRSSSGVFDDTPYEGTYEFMSSEQPYAPPAVTPKPFVQGPQTATVVGKGEIDVDEYGRILVRFHWDRKNDKSMRVRIAQVWAGNKWGGIYIPRVGMEAVVQFLEGNPDMPLVVGTVYNDDNKPPYPLDGEKNVAGIKSNSTPGGGGFNEYVFDDTKGSELIRQHGQKDLDSVVENDEKWLIKRDRHVTIDRNETRTVGGNRTTKIGKKAPPSGVDTLEVGDTLKISAETMIELKVGGSKITMTQMGITIEAMMIDINAKANLTTKAIMSSHEATGVMTIKGGLVLINSS